MQFVVLLFSDLPVLIVGGCIVIWYIYQVIAGIIRFIRTKLTGGGHSQFGSYVKDTILNSVSCGIVMRALIALVLIANVFMPIHSFPC